MTIKFSSDDDFPLNKIMKYILTIIDSNIFEENGSLYSQIYLDDCLYEVEMLAYERIDISERIDPSRSNEQKM